MCKKSTSLFLCCIVALLCICFLCFNWACKRGLLFVQENFHTKKVLPILYFVLRGHAYQQGIALFVLCFKRACIPTRYYLACCQFQKDLHTNKFVACFRQTCIPGEGTIFTTHHHLHLEQRANGLEYFSRNICFEQYSFLDS